MKLALCVKRRSQKTADRFGAGPCLAWTLERKLIFSRSNKPEVKDSHENMGHRRRRADSAVLSQLFGAASQYG
jgi:hypothetical protein